MTANDLQLRLTEICRQIAQGEYEEAKSVLDLPPCDNPNAPIAVLVEAISMMLLRIEAREFELSKSLRKVEKSREDLKQHKKRLTHENVRLRKELFRKSAIEQPIGKTPEMQEVIRQAGRVAQVSSTVLLCGETGTGKSLFAQYIHEMSDRVESPFVAINCSSLPPAMIDSELFGVDYENSFEENSRIGRFEQAEGGTIFLEEIGTLPLESQIKLLNFLETGKIKKVGSDNFVPINVRIIAATSENLEQNVKNKTFREDLYYRLNVISMHLPPLRERRSDIPLLVTHIIKTKNSDNPRLPSNINIEALDILVRYNWPGNVRELENTMERAMLFAKGRRLILADLPSEIINIVNRTHLPLLPVVPKPNRENVSGKDPFTGKNVRKLIEDAGLPTLEDVENMFIITILTHFRGNKSVAARTLGISREGLRMRIDKIKSDLSNSSQ